MIIVGVLTLMNIIIITPSERSGSESKFKTSAGCYRAIIHSACSGGGRSTHRKKRVARSVGFEGKADGMQSVAMLT